MARTKCYHGSPIARRAFLIKNDRQKFTATPVDGFYLLFSDTNPSKVIGYCIGPQQSLYQDCLLVFEYIYPDQFPGKMPEIRLKTKILHPSVVRGKFHLYSLAKHFYGNNSLINALEEFKNALKNPDFEDCVNLKVRGFYRAGTFEDKVRQSLRASR